MEAMEGAGWLARLFLIIEMVTTTSIVLFNQMSLNYSFSRFHFWLNNNNNNNIFQDRFDSMRQALSDSKRQNHSLTNTVHLLQDRLADMELQYRNLEKQKHHLHEVSDDGRGGLI